jgi:hypothetical protein
MTQPPHRPDLVGTGAAGERRTLRPLAEKLDLAYGSKTLRLIESSSNNPAYETIWGRTRESLANPPSHLWTLST